MGAYSPRSPTPTPTTTDTARRTTPCMWPTSPDMKKFLLMRARWSLPLSRSGTPSPSECTPAPPSNTTTAESTMTPIAERAAQPRHPGGRLRQERARAVLDCQELLGGQLGRPRIHQHEDGGQ